jgi:hypothetical protein
MSFLVQVQVIAPEVARRGRKDKARASLVPRAASRAAMRPSAVSGPIRTRDENSPIARSRDGVRRDLESRS